MAGDPNDTVNDVVFGVVEEITTTEHSKYYTTPYAAKDKGKCDQVKVCFDLMESCNCYEGSSFCYAILCEDKHLYSICHCGWREEP